MPVKLTKESEGYVKFKIKGAGVKNEKLEPFIIDIGDEITFGRSIENMVVLEKSRLGKYKICDKHFVIGLGAGGWYI